MEKTDKNKKPALKQTNLGTVIRMEWSDPYYMAVCDAEMEAKRAICGAPTKKGDPCKGRPQEEYHYYCRLHRYSGKLQLTAQETKYPVKTTSRPPVLVHDEIIHGLARCNICPVRRLCGSFINGHHCSVEERAVTQFLDTVHQDYELDDIDDYMLLPAAFSFVNIVRARIQQARMNPDEAEASRLSWLAPREQKEFTRMMKELGLTRKERLEQERDRAIATGMPSGASLAQVMSAISDEVTVTQELTIKKKKDDNVIDVEGEIVDDESGD